MGRLSNFSPATIDDPSLRFILSKTLYEPYFDVKNWNISVDLVDSQIDMTLEQSTSFAIGAGRP